MVIHFDGGQVHFHCKGISVQILPSLSLQLLLRCNLKSESDFQMWALRKQEFFLTADTQTRGMNKQPVWTWCSLPEKNRNTPCSAGLAETHAPRWRGERENRWCVFDFSTIRCVGWMVIEATATSPWFNTAVGCSSLINPDQESSWKPWFNDILSLLILANRYACLTPTSFVMSVYFLEYWTCASVALQIFFII